MLSRKSPSTRSSVLPICLLLGLIGALQAPVVAEQDLPKTSGWIEVETDNFTLYSNAPTKRSSKIAVQLERFRQTLGRITRGFELDSDVPTSMYVFKSEPSFVPYKQNADGTTMNVAGYFLPRPFGNFIMLDASAGSRPMRVVYHEFFHAVMDNSLGSLPVWVNEGLAEYFSTFKNRGGPGMVEVGHPIESHAQYLAEQGLLGWDSFFAMTTESPDYNEGTRQGSFYAQAWLTVSYLNADDARSKQLGKYLAALRDGAEEEKAFTEAFGMTKAEMGAAVDAYRKAGRTSFPWWDLGEQHGEVDVAVREMPGAEVLYRLGVLLAQLGRQPAAKAHLDAAAEQGWDAGAVNGALGVASWHTGDPFGAEPALRKAVEAGYTSAETCVVLSKLVMNRYFNTPESRKHTRETPAPVIEARGLIERGLEDQPRSVEGLVDLARTYLFGTEDTGPGVAAIERARAIRPLDTQVLSMQAALLARDGKVEQACTLVREEIAPKDADAAKQASSLVADGVLTATMGRIDREDTEGAKEILSAALEHLEHSKSREQMQRLHEVISSGGRIVLDQGSDKEGEPSPVEIAVDRYNEAVALLNAGRMEEAEAKMQQAADDCSDEKLCATVLEDLEELRRVMAHNRTILRYNEATELANKGKRKEALEILYELEATVEDPDALNEVQKLLRRLGARVTKKKK